MPYNYDVLPRAQRHLEESIEYYQLHSDTAASNFIKNFKNALATICNDSLTTRQSYRGFFHYYLNKFPFTIIYSINEFKNLVTIRAIYHQKRNPKGKYRKL
ncbi:type II toxin-antitoxin system RelE/ParE family toxin [Mucilaginibacter ginkgonis]|uniref:Type II toxin-antitoxin system RelE/ParE family toxin n=1 Tax=Mucilaginibacter ginkgonis TaxID=2682091 RepID=A0A6I4I087_9SPHI|nr:type II toxin-antitoxin system RelE/ParE family toxin [Mucilaginibacter ginkgonis]